MGNRWDELLAGSGLCLVEIVIESFCPYGQPRPSLRLSVNCRRSLSVFSRRWLEHFDVCLSAHEIFL